MRGELKMHIVGEFNKNNWEALLEEVCEGIQNGRTMLDEHLLQRSQERNIPISMVAAIFNTGKIVEGYDAGEQGSKIKNPLPSYKVAATIDGISYVLVFYQEAYRFVAKTTYRICEEKAAKLLGKELRSELSM